MHIKKFIFEFVDHEKRTCTEYVIAIHTGRSMEWAHDENDIDGYIKWLTQHVRWEHKLKQQVTRIIKDKFFDSKDENDLMKFGDFIISKEKTERKSVNVNMNQSEATEVRFRQIHHMEKTKNKFTRGPNPAKWTDIFNYDKIHHHFSYHLVGNEMDENIELRQVSSFDIPKEPVASFKSENKDEPIRNRNTVETASATNRIMKNTTTANQNVSKLPPATIPGQSSIPMHNRPASNTSAINQAISRTIANNPTLSNAQTATNTMRNQTTRTNTSVLNQAGGDDKQQRRYKQKYLNLKNEFY